jgi:tetratricopeptide (TPR) repeat protein
MPSRTKRLLLLLLLCAPLGSAHGQAHLAAADRLWEARASELDGLLASADRTEAAIRAYRSAVEAEPGAIEARWKLLRALHYLIDFTNATKARQEEALKEAASFSNAWIAAADEAGETLRDRAQLYFWSAIVFGARGQRAGLLTLVREGIATRTHEYALRAADLDPTIERGGAYRLLSRLHGSLPRVPLVSGWVDRGQALPLAERAFEIDPDDPGNRLVLAVTLLERAPERRAEAIELLEGVLRTTPRETLRAEDLAIREKARERLAQERPT